MEYTHNHLYLPKYNQIQAPKRSMQCKEQRMYRLKWTYRSYDLIQLSDIPFNSIN